MKILTKEHGEHKIYEVDTRWAVCFMNGKVWFCVKDGKGTEVEIKICNLVHIKA